MTALRQSAALWSFEAAGLTATDVIAAAAEIGYEGMDVVPEQHWQLVRSHGMTVATAMGHESIINGLNRHENGDRIERELKTNIEKAAAAGVPGLICFSGSGTPGIDGAEATARNLERAAPFAEEAGVTLLLELLNSRIDHPGYECDRTQWGVRVCDMVGSPRVRLLYDVYHMQVMEGDIINTIGAFSAYFGHYHTAGSPGRADLDADQELNYRAIFRAIEATGYTGFVGHEFVPKGDPVAAMRAAYESCRSA